MLHPRLHGAHCRAAARRASCISYNGDTRRYAGSGSLFDTFAQTVKAVLWEKLLFIEWWGPAALSNTEYKRVSEARFLRVYGRRLIVVDGNRSDANWRCAIISGWPNAGIA